jgi:hypothetical protein
MNAIPIPVLGSLIIRCWANAEQALQESLKDSPDSDEEFVTRLFQSKLSLEFDEVSTSGAVARAFLSDLDRTFPHVEHTSLSAISNGLVATVSFHDRVTEAATGGDLGIVIIRPDVQEVVYRGSDLNISDDYQRGILCQAKMFRRNSKWGPLTRKQKQTLPNRLEYFALLLYRYADQKGERRDLESFIWQLAGDATLEQISQWLVSGQFPNPQNSQQILGALIHGTIGTDNKKLIEMDIAPPLRSSLVIRIRWRDDGPGTTVRVRQRVSHHTQQQVHVQH